MLRWNSGESKGNCFMVQSSKSQAPSSKLQKNSKFQNPNPKLVPRAPTLGFGARDFLEICGLGLGISFSVHAGEDQQQFLRFAIKDTGLVCQLRLGRGDHPKEEL